MKHLLTVILILFVGIGSWLAFARPEAIRPSVDLDIAVSYDAVPEAQAAPEAAPFADERYYGDTLYQYDGKTVLIDYSDTDPEMPSLSASKLVTYADTSLLHTCRVIGCGWYVADGPKIKFAIGVDTMCYDMRSLPDSVDPVRDLLSKDVVEHRYSRVFSLSDSSRDCGFKLQAYLPPRYPDGLKRLMALQMDCFIEAFFSGERADGDILAKYYDKIDPTPGEGANSPEQIAAHFAGEFEKHYREEYYDCGSFAPCNDYMLLIAPAWSSADGRYTTYRFYSYNYGGGCHGDMQEYYLTFDNQSGRILGYEDIFGSRNFPKAINLLEDKLTAYASDRCGPGEKFPASLDKEWFEWDGSDLTKEGFCGSYYPRPALTESGIVFTYQPYEKGPFSDGILHFVISYSEAGLSGLNPQIIKYCGRQLMPKTSPAPPQLPTENLWQAWSRFTIR